MSSTRQAGPLSGNRSRNASAEAKVSVAKPLAARERDKLRRMLGSSSTTTTVKDGPDEPGLFLAAFRASSKNNRWDKLRPLPIVHRGRNGGRLFRFRVGTF